MKSPASPAKRLRILLVGDWQASEFASAVSDLRRLASVRGTQSLSEAIRLLKNGFAATHIVMAQTRRGRIADEAVARIHRLCPLARLIALLGTFCEGEMRTGAPLPGVQRVYWHQWRARFLSELESQAGGRLSQPRTFTEFDLSLGAGRPRFVSGPIEEDLTHSSDYPLTIAIGAHRWQDFQGIREALGLQAASVVWANDPADSQPPTPPAHYRPAWLLWDAAAWDDTEKGQLKQTILDYAPRKTLLLLGWPRGDDVQEAIQMGVTTTLSKPYLLTDLIALLRQPSKLAA